MINKDSAVAVDNADWLKTAAIIFVVVDHIGYFFIDDAQWWSVFGRIAAPIFFFLLGYAHSRTIPLRWISLGLILTLLDSWNNDWTWVAPNILLSLAFIRFARPYVLRRLQHDRWVSFTVLILILLMVLPIIGDMVEYGAEGWLWALVGLCQRMYVDGKSSTGLDGTGQKPEVPVQGVNQNWGLKRVLACSIAAIVYVWQEQIEFEFSDFQLAVVVLGIGLLSYWLCVFVRGRSCVQPPERISVPLRYIGRHTLEIYAIQLAGSELIIRLIPQIAA